MKTYQVRIPIKAYWVENVEAEDKESAKTMVLPYDSYERVQDIECDLSDAEAYEMSGE